jgi:hypothetical protein
MKKSLLILGLVAAGFSATAQTYAVDTLTKHSSTNIFAGIIDDVAPIDSGFIGGNNGYGDKAKMQLFDNQYGVTHGGTVTGVAFYAPIKVDGGGSISVNIWADNAGEPGAILGSATVTLASIDTSMAAMNLVNDSIVYNHVAMFSTPVTIPAGNKFWAGAVLPTGANTFMFPIIFPFADALTHTGEFWSDDSFHTMGEPQNWGSIALTIYPIVNLVVGMEENVIEASVSPNPAADVLNIKISEEIASVVITTLDGKVVATEAANAINVTELNAGMYIYTVTTANGKVATGNFVKK